MSTVYLAQQRSLERKVAIKVMRRVFTADVDAAQIEKRFLLEGRMLAKLPHRNIVAVYDIVSNDDIAYIAMEYLGGGVLSDRMRTGLSVDGRADQYSLGILFYELLTGAPPFRADTSIAVLMAHLSQPLPPLPPEFHAFEDVIARMLSKNRDERYPNLNEFNEDLKSRLF